MVEKVYVLIYTYSGDVVYTDCSVYSKKEDAEQAFHEKCVEIMSNHSNLNIIDNKDNFVLYTECDESLPIEDYEYIELTIEEQNIL